MKRAVLRRNNLAAALTFALVAPALAGWSPNNETWSASHQTPPEADAIEADFGKAADHPFGTAQNRSVFTSVVSEHA